MTDKLAVATVSLPTPVTEVLRQWQEYQELTQQLLDSSDYQATKEGKRYKTKSAWRKYARAFNLTDEVVSEEIHRAEDGFPLWARIRVRATAPNGRSSEADHECHVTERCSREKCQPDCNGRSHWAHPGDLPATALTRAKNRAISDLIGAGEVSAEEIDDIDTAPSQHTATSPPNPISFTCPVHKTPWFKKGKMQNFAHPIEGQPGKWCNMPEPEALAKPTPVLNKPMTPADFTFEVQRRGYPDLQAMLQTLQVDSDGFKALVKAEKYEGVLKRLPDLIVPQTEGSDEEIYGSPEEVENGPY